ncbi:hypothetical protein BDF22DRAFT_112381 [Syncephalis plumigaleata]|nr:hypothetical protein BDF22DRAFT_112381 [Syncephalis plumigaleata]
MSPKKKPHGHGVQNWKNNITMERRKADLMDVFEEKKIVIDSELPDLYRRQLMASGQPVEHKSDRRTIYRAVRALELEGKVKQITVNIPLLIGNQLMRILYLHSSVDPDSDLVRDTIKHIRHDMSMRSHPSLTPKVMLHNTEAKIVDPTSTGSPTANASDETLEANRNWMHNAFNNGWIRQRMVRIKLLHLHLFTLFEQCGERTIETVTIFREMPLGLFLQVIGFGFKCKEIETFLEERSDARQVKLSDLNVELRSFLFVRSDRLRRHFDDCYAT